jgi:pimeloyl-ACP methyl ester carboxylesterase
MFSYIQAGHYGIALPRLSLIMMVFDILTNKPLKGSCYNQVDNSGLFWSMKMVTSDLHYTSFLKRIDSLKDEHLYIDIVFEDSIILSKEIVRISVDESVSIDTISIDGTDVFLYKGLQGKDKPILITLGGSEGGSFWGNLISGALSSRGFYSLSIPYVNIPNQPTTFENIDLKLFESAISFLRKHYPSQKIIPIGVSRGGELSLLISSMFGLDGAIAYCPSNVVWSGYSKYKRIQDFPAWVIEEKEIPYISAKMPPFGKFSSDHYMYTMKYSKNLPLIEVEKILGPILLITGQDDRVWPANYMSKCIVDRLDSLDFQYEINHINYKNSGYHIAFPGYYPTTTYDSFGGDAQNNAHSQISSWKAVQEYLNKLSVKE